MKLRSQALLISTLAIALGFTFALARGGLAGLTTNVARTADDSPDPTLRTPRFPVQRKRLQDALTDVPDRLDRWHLVEEDGNRFVFEVRTPVLRFTDDLTVEIRKGSSGFDLYIESQSRIGKGDLGENARHIRRLIRYLESTLDTP